MHTAGLETDEVGGMAGEQAIKCLEQYMTTGK